MKKYYCPNGSSELDGSVFYIIITFFGYCLAKTRNTYRLNILKRSDLVEHIDI
jgi:hypothetical protein